MKDSERGKGDIRCSKCMFQKEIKEFTNDFDFKGYKSIICDNPESERYGQWATRHYCCSKFQKRVQLQIEFPNPLILK